MRTIYYLLLIWSYSMHSQDIAYIKTLDTIFVSFKKNKLQTKIELPKNNFNFYDRWYTINFEDYENKTIKVYLQFDYTIYPSSERRVLGVKSDYQLVKKSYLRKIKNKIVGIDFFKKYGIYRSTYEAFEKYKVIYIIDYSETKKGKTPIYEVSKFSSYHMGE